MVRALQSLRRGEITDDVQQLVADCAVAEGAGAILGRGAGATMAVEAGGAEGEGISLKPTKLYCRNVDVDQINAAELAKLPTASCTCVGHEKIEPDPWPAAYRDAHPDAPSRELIEREVRMLEKKFKDCRAVSECTLETRNAKLVSTR